MKQIDDNYKSHDTFDSLTDYAKFYDSLAHLTFPWVSLGTQAVCSIDSYIFSSIEGTLLSIQAILSDGKINDSYALLRKYHDSIIINAYSILELKEKSNTKDLVVKQIDDWMSGKDQLPEYRVMSQRIRGSNIFKKIVAVIYQDNRYQIIRDRCNDHTHYNFFRNILLNDNKIHLKGRIEALDVFHEDLRDLFILHLALIFTINDHYMMSSDHLDCLELGMPPEPESEFWVATFIQKTFDQIVTAHRPDVTAVLKSQTNMQLT